MTNTVSHGNFAEGSVRKNILSQAIPLTLAQFVQLLYNIVDRIYIGHMPGADAGVALTGLGLCFPIITLISSFVNLVFTGAAPLCSMSRGNRDTKKAGKILTTAYSLLVIISISIAIIIFFVKKPLLYLLGASDVTYGYAVEYLNIYLTGTLFFAIGTGMNIFISLQGYPRIGMFTTIIGAIINLILDPILIFGFNMGVKGAAIATVWSQLCSALWVLFYLSKKDMELKFNPFRFTVHSELLKSILTLGMPGFIMGVTNSAVQSVCNATLSVYGGDTYIAIMTIFNSVREISSLPINGITSGSQPVLSYNYGAKEYVRVKEGIKFTAFVALCYTGIFWISTLLFPTVYLHFFSSDAYIIKIGKMPLMIYFLGYIFMTFQFSAQSTFVALGRAKHAVFFSIFRKIIIVVPLTILLPKIPSVGVLGVFWAEPISNLIGGMASFITMIQTVYKNLIE
ncbi:MAG TPA: MATE family efflux transporter [Epulopiscium sp.]|nr:MATE family efflux transporter [Candidatus Epulonipiscium sp.]